jgi:hypothetical protein
MVLPTVVPHQEGAEVLGQPLPGDTARDSQLAQGTAGDRRTCDAVSRGRNTADLLGLRPTGMTGAAAGSAHEQNSREQR